MTRAVLRWLADFPSTNGRIVVGLGLSIATGVRVVVSDWHPDSEWLLFLAGLAAIEVGQFAVKRVTSAEHVAAKQQTQTHPIPPREDTPG